MNQNELPESYGIDDIFFGDDDRLDLDMSKGRLPKEEIKSNNQEQNKKADKVTGGKLSSVQNKIGNQEALIKQAKMLKKFEERTKKHQEKEFKNKQKAAARHKAKQAAKERKKANKPVPIQATQNKLQDLSQCNDHIDTFDHFDGQLVVSRCKNCSRAKTWNPKEWRKANPVVPSVMNPNPQLFPF